MQRIAIVYLILFIGLFSCKKGKIEEKITTDAELITVLKASPESIVIGSDSLVLKTYIWRDFMPIAEENGSPMFCINFLTDKDSLNIEQSIILKKQYVINGEKVWTSDYTEVKDPSSFYMEGYISGGPKWGPDIYVDVVCEFKYLGSTYRILAKAQEIEMTQ
ncbi:MAG TPA: hypothetical protein VFD77_03120 [Brumimicrobium sp.]|nr:hypothetical protein [Brumimicrobium sp.]